MKNNCPQVGVPEAKTAAIAFTRSTSQIARYYMLRMTFPRAIGVIEFKFGRAHLQAN